jgi:Toprim-like
METPATWRFGANGFDPTRIDGAHRYRWFDVVTRPGWRIDDVLARTDLADLLDQLAEPAMFATRGRRWHCPLPDHDDHHASVTIHTDHRGHQRWRCWSGDNNHRGDAIDLVCVTQRLDRINALDWLAALNGMIPDVPLPPVARREPVVRQSSDVPLDPCVIRYVEACEKILWRPSGRPVLDWLHGRGFDDDLLRANRVGCDPGRDMMQRQRGLAYGGSIGAVFPALNEQGDVHYVQTRYLKPGNGPKYDNPAASLAANPRLAWTRSVKGTAGGRVVVCEGIPDALTAAETGFQSIATLGSNVGDATAAARVARYTEMRRLTVTLVNDNDGAGRTWGDHWTTALASLGVTVHRVEPPDVGLDLNAWRTQMNSSSSDPLVAANERQLRFLGLR